jgi:hypothetical protein
MGHDAETSDEGVSMRRWRWVVVVAVTACSASGPAADPPTGSEIAVVPSATASPEPVPPADPARADAVFLTAVDEILTGTAYAGLVDVVPGEFLLTADAICAGLQEGAEPDDLVAAYLGPLGLDAGAVPDDAAVLAGTLLGAAVEVYCPQYGDRLPPPRG